MLTADPRGATCATLIRRALRAEAGGVASQILTIGLRLLDATEQDAIDLPDER